MIRRLLYDGAKSTAIAGDKAPLTEAVIVDNIFTLVFAGTDTTALILTSAFHKLGNNHEVRERIHGCIDRVEYLEPSENEELDELQQCYPAATFTMRTISDTCSGQGIDLEEYGCVPPDYNITYAIAGTSLNDKHSYQNSTVELNRSKRSV